jgi:formylglycine-generating enzyme required for sulfatase activity
VLPFYIDRTEVTMRDYVRCEKAGNCSSTKDHAVEQKPYKGLELCNEGRAQRGERLDDNPVNCVDRGQAAAYCASLNKRLPTDEEWEAAARGPQGAEYPWGSASPSCDKAVFGHPPGNACPGYGTARIASTPATPLGIFDLAGNVWEWTSTVCPGATALGAPATNTLPTAAPTASPALDKEEAELARLTRQAQEPKVEFEPGPGTLRGGGFEWSADSLRSWRHLAFPPGEGGVSAGFRCAKDAP